ncbi:hypothetical protein [Succinivibrio dextrinosolvens]|jgi:hypothetical protein|uniref:hypothetical protein n=1 Tax=Succinivibrio dextrinosolvens TaxID=83771 RepID=UPI00241E84EA|nr:hypothetical protein [Succinivibrio dextrinosolvens]MBE6423112.1 hypothetical protein [Succinivibrio dextrinosolvens]
MLKKIQGIIGKRIDRLLNKFNDKSANAAHIAAMYVLIATFYNVAVEAELLSHTMQLVTIYFCFVVLLILFTNE